MGVVANIRGPKGDVGDQGVSGPAGAAGPAGSVWHSGSGTPADTVGVDGDYYLNNTTGDVSVKAAGTWA